MCTYIKSTFTNVTVQVCEGKDATTSQLRSELQAKADELAKLNSDTHTLLEEQAALKQVSPSTHTPLL